MKSTQEINLIIGQENYTKITVIANDHNSSFLRCHLKNNDNSIFEIEEGTDFFMATETGLGNTVDVQGEVIDYDMGIVDFEIKSNMIPIENCNQEFQVRALKVLDLQESERLSSWIFTVIVGRSLIDEGTEAILADNYTPILDDLHEVNLNLQEMIDKVGEPTDDETKSTIFGWFKKLYNYCVLKFTSIIGYVDTIESTQSTHTATLDTIKNYVDTVETTQSTHTSSLNTIKNYVDTVETTQSTHTTLLNDIKTGVTSVQVNLTAKFISAPVFAGKTDVTLPFSGSGSYNLYEENMLITRYFIPHLSGTIAIYSSITGTQGTRTVRLGIGIAEIDSTKNIGDVAIPTQSVYSDYSYSVETTSTFTLIANVEVGKRYAILVGGKTGGTGTGYYTLKNWNGNVTFANVTEYIFK